MSLDIGQELTFPEAVVLLSTVVEIQSENGTVTEEFSKVKTIKVKTMAAQEIMATSVHSFLYL